MKDKKADAMQAYLERQGKSYHRLEGRTGGVIYTSFDTESKLNPVRVVLDSEVGGIVVDAISPLLAGEGTRGELLKYLTEVNATARRGGFVLKSGKGEIRYKVGVCCDGMGELPEAIIAEAVRIGIEAYAKHGDAIARLAMGRSSAAKELEAAGLPAWGGTDAADESEEEEEKDERPVDLKGLERLLDKLLREKGIDPDEIK